MEALSAIILSQTPKVATIRHAAHKLRFLGLKYLRQSPAATLSWKPVWQVSATAACPVQHEERLELSGAAGWSWDKAVNAKRTVDRQLTSEPTFVG